MSSGINNFLVPLHSIASEGELKKLFESFGITEEDLPLIKESDPALAELGAKPGDVIRCDRLSPVTKKIEFYYRKVIASED